MSGQSFGLSLIYLSPLPSRTTTHRPQQAMANAITAFKGGDAALWIYF